MKRTRGVFLELLFRKSVRDEFRREALTGLAKLDGKGELRVLLDAGVAGCLARGEIAPRYHASSRPPYVEAVATARAVAFARATGAPVHIVHLSSAAALDEVGARGVCAMKRTFWHRRPFVPRI